MMPFIPLPEIKKERVMRDIFYAIDYASEGRDSYAVEKFVEWFSKIEKIGAEE